MLQYRPFSDTVNTLLHEMIHAHQFLLLQSGASRQVIDRDGHGPDFCALMERINSTEGAHISVYHSFHGEVDHLKKHVWRCTGPCRLRPPYFGWVKRAMNRPPQPADSWYSMHAATCTGRFVKVEGDVFIGKKSAGKLEGKKKAIKENDKLNPNATASTSTSIATSASTSTPMATPMATNQSKLNFCPKIYTCVACEQFRTPSLEALNAHLDTNCGVLVDEKTVQKESVDEKGRLVIQLD